MQTEGWRGLFKGTALGLVGVSNGAIQFMAYEQMKKWGFERKRKHFEKTGKPWTPEVDKLVSFPAFAFLHIHRATDHHRIRLSLLYL